MSKAHVKKLINSMSVDNREQPLFFGEGMGMQRYDIPKYKQIDNFYDKQWLFFWKPQEISLNKDKEDFASLTDNERRIFTQNLGYQILLDSVQSRGIIHLLEYCSNTELESFLELWAVFEGIHSKSYSYIIQNVYPDPTKVLDQLSRDENIMERAYGVTKYYDDLINSMDDDSVHEKKKKVYLTLVSIQILEAVRFYISFACSYYFDEMGKMTGNSKIIQLINRDENLHVGFTNFLIKTLTGNEVEGFQDVVKECKPIVEQMWRDAADEEIKWAKYLFKDDDLFGLNAEILEKYMYYLCNLRMKNCGMKRIFETTKNPILWIQKYTNSSAVQNAPQESENISYLSNSVSSESTTNLEDMAL